RRILDALARAGIADERVHVVAGRYGQAKELPLKKVEHALGVPIPYQIPDAPADVNLAVNKGVPVVLERPRAKVSRSFAKLATAIKEIHAAHHRNGHGKIAAIFPSATRDYHFQAQNGK